MEMHYINIYIVVSTSQLQYFYVYSVMHDSVDTGPILDQALSCKRSHLIIHIVIMILTWGIRAAGPGVFSHNLQCQTLLNISMKVSQIMKVIPTSRTTLLIRGRVPLQNAFGPSFTIICLKIIDTAGFYHFHLPCTIKGVLILAGIQALHPGLYHIQWGVSQH